MVEQEMNGIMINVEKHLFNQLFNNVRQMLSLLQSKSLIFKQKKIFFSFLVEDQQAYHHMKILKNFDLDVVQLMVLCYVKLQCGILVYFDRMVFYPFKVLRNDF